MSETAFYEHETTDQHARFTVATTLCTGRAYAQYPDSYSRAVVIYTNKITAAVRGDNQNVVNEDEDKAVHVRMATLLRRNEEGEVDVHIDSGVVPCGCE